MKSDKPFQKFFICGFCLFVVGSLLSLAFTKSSEHNYIKYDRIFIVSFAPAAFAAAWAFFSKRKWSWIRFLVVTFLALLFCFVVIANIAESANRQSWPVPEIVIANQALPSWVAKKGPPVTDLKNNPIGSQFVFKNRDRKRILWIEAWNSQQSFQSVVEWQKELVENRARESGFEITDKKNYCDPANKKNATLILRSQKGDTTNNIVCKFWADELEHEQIILASVALGKNIEIISDEEIAEIISGVTIK